MNENFQTFITEIQNKILPLPHKLYEINENHVVLDIQKNTIISILLKNENSKEHIVVEEIFAPEGVPAILKNICRKYAKMWVSYYEFNGELGKSNPFMGESQYETIKAALPELKIDERYNEWPGYPTFFVALKLQEKDMVGYAVINYHDACDIASFKEISKQLINAYLNAKSNEEEFGNKNKKYIIGTSVYQFLIDENMCKILESRYFTKESTYIKNNYGFEIGDIFGRWIQTYAKHSNEITEDILNKMKQENESDNPENRFIEIYTEAEQKSLPKLSEMQEEFFYITVAYVDVFDSYRTYNYLSEDKTIKRGDKVLVNRSGTETVALVLKAQSYKRYEVPFPVEKTKQIIKKIESNEELEKYGFTPDDFPTLDEDDSELLNTYFIVTTLSDNLEVIKKISWGLLECNLVAGSQISEVLSSFWWNGRIESKKEYKLEVRTRGDKVAPIRELIKSVHNYVVPEISATQITCTTQDMEDWIDESVQRNFFRMD